jgi:hypothetical protein
MLAFTRFCLVGLLLTLSYSVSADSYDLGLIAAQQKQYGKAEQHFLHAADQGDAGAAYELWKFYQYGNQEIKQNSNQALQWLLVAAYYGMAQAQFELGLQYQVRSTIPHASEHALHWLQAAAAQSHPQAYYRLAEAYQQGMGTAVDYRLAQQYYQRAVGFFRVHAEKGNSQAQFQLARCYEQGQGLAQDWSSALAWYKKAGMNGYTPGLFHTGRLLLVQAKNRDQLKQAAYWLKQAEQKGSKQAVSMLQALNQRLRESAVAER